MALEVTQVHRNLHQRVTWLYLEIEDMFLVLGLGVLANFVGRFLGREVYGIPLSFIRSGWCRSWPFRACGCSSMENREGTFVIF